MKPVGKVELVGRRAVPHDWAAALYVAVRMGMNVLSVLCWRVRDWGGVVRVI